MRGSWHWRMERKLNIVSHFFGIVLAIILKNNVDLPEAIELTFYGSFVVLFLASCLYHYSEQEVEVKAETFFYKVDVSMIAVAVTSSCFAHAFILPQIAWQNPSLVISALIMLTLIAAIIIYLVFGNGKRTSTLVNMLFVLQVAIPTFALPNWQRVFETPMIVLITGVACYGTGMYFVLNDQKHRYYHFIWHLWVLAGFYLHHCALVISL